MRLLIASANPNDTDVIASDLQRAGLPPDTSATVLTVADVLAPPPSAEGAAALSVVARRARERAASALADAERAAAESRTRLAAAFPTWKLDAAALADAPAWAILRKAEEGNAELIAVGSRDRSVITRAVLGSVAQSVLWQARSSVRIMRASQAAAGAPIRLVVGIDGSPSADHAAAAVAARRWPRGTQVRLVTAMDWTMAVMLRYADTDKDESSAARRKLEETAAKLRAAGLEVSADVVEGDPKHVLPAQAEQVGADCIFVGALGLRGIERLLLGSVSAAITARAHCSVEVVRA